MLKSAQMRRNYGIRAISEQPDEFAYARHLGELKWVSDFEVALINKKGTEKFSANLEN